MTGGDKQLAIICRYQNVPGSADVKWAELRDSMSAMEITPAVVYDGQQLTTDEMDKHVRGFQRCRPFWVRNLIITNFALDLKYGL